LARSARLRTGARVPGKYSGILPQYYRKSDCAEPGFVLDKRDPAAMRRVPEFSGMNRGSEADVMRSGACRRNDRTGHLRDAGNRRSRDIASTGQAARGIGIALIGFALAMVVLTPPRSNSPAGR